MVILNEFDIPCGPILSMNELAEEPSLRKTGTVVEVDHPTRGKLSDGRQPNQAVGQPDRGDALAAPGRAHRRDPAQGPAVRRGPASPSSRIRAHWAAPSRWRRNSRAAGVIPRCGIFPGAERGSYGWAVRSQPAEAATRMNIHEYQAKQPLAEIRGCGPQGRRRLHRRRRRPAGRAKASPGRSMS